MTKEEHEARSKARNRVEGLFVDLDPDDPSVLPIPGLREAPLGVLGGGS